MLHLLRAYHVHSYCKVEMIPCLNKWGIWSSAKLRHFTQITRLVLKWGSQSGHFLSQYIRTSNIAKKDHYVITTVGLFHFPLLLQVLAPELKCHFPYFLCFSFHYYFPSSLYRVGQGQFKRKGIPESWSEAPGKSLCISSAGPKGWFMEGRVVTWQ